MVKRSGAIIAGALLLVLLVSMGDRARQRCVPSDRATMRLIVHVTNTGVAISTGISSDPVGAIDNRSSWRTTVRTLADGGEVFVQVTNDIAMLEGNAKLLPESGEVEVAGSVDFRIAFEVRDDRAQPSRVLESGWIEPGSFKRRIAVPAPENPTGP